MVWSQYINGISYNFLGSSDTSSDIIKEENNVTFRYPCSNSSICYPYALKFHPGTYFITLYGASGGNNRYESETIKAGNGGLVSALIDTKRRSPTLYLYIGGKGRDRNSTDEDSQDMEDIMAAVIQINTEAVAEVLLT